MRGEVKRLEFRSNAAYITGLLMLVKDCVDRKKK
jgi:hypothetical protein